MSNRTYTSNFAPPLNANPGDFWHDGQGNIRLLDAEGKHWMLISAAKEETVPFPKDLSEPVKSKPLDNSRNFREKMEAFNQKLKENVNH